MKAFRAISMLVFIGAILIAIWWIVAALFSGQNSGNPIVYGLIAGAVIIAVVIFKNNLFSRILGRVGESTGEKRGPEPGEGAVIHHSSGEADFDGSSEDVSRPAKDPDRDLPYPRKRSAD